jgi:hypothetical protein
MEEKLIPANAWLSFLNTIKKTTSEPDIMSWLVYKSAKVINSFRVKHLNNDAELVHTWALSSFYSKKDLLNLSDLERIEFQPETFFLTETIAALYLDSELNNKLISNINIENEYLLSNYIKYSAMRDTSDLVTEIIIVLSKTSEQTNLRYIDNCLHIISDHLKRKDFQELIYYLEISTGNKTDQESTLNNLIDSMAYAEQLIYYDSAGVKTEKLNRAIKQLVLTNQEKSLRFLKSVWSKNILLGRAEMATLT